MVLGWLWWIFIVVFQTGREMDLASADARRFTQIESMSLTLHSFKSSKPLRDVL
nr:MAG TPA: hypothetical protein [Caudoviricetes sp.]